MSVNNNCNNNKKMCLFKYSDVIYLLNGLESAGSGLPQTLAKNAEKKMRVPSLEHFSGW